MFTALAAYIKNIALLMLLTVFIEIVVPNAKIKKYVSVVVGLIMIFTIIGNLSSLVDNIKSDSVPVFKSSGIDFDKTENVREKLTGILYNEMNKVENETENNDGLDICVERIRPYD